MTTALIFEFDAASGDTNVLIGSAKDETRVIYVGAGIDGALTMKTVHPSNAADFLPIDGAAFSAAGAYSFTVPKGMKLYYSYAGTVTTKIAIK